VQITLNLAGSSASEIDLIGDELVLTKQVLDAHKVEAIRKLEAMGESDQRYRQIAPVDANAARLQLRSMCSIWKNWREPRPSTSHDNFSVSGTS
ncbi:hypothetical protein, partial [Undibacterium sp. 10I3]